MKHKFFLLLSLSLVVLSVGKAQELITLDQAIAVALEKNYDIRLAKGISDSRATDKKYSSGVFLPVVNATASTTWNDTDQEFKFADETRNTSGNAESHNTAASAQLVWTLFDGTRMFSTHERINQLSIQGELQLKNQMVNTIADVIVSYHNIVRQKQQLRATQEQMKVNEERVKLADRKLQVGTGAKPELLQAKVDLNEQKTNVLTQEALIQQLKDQLNGLLGMQLPSPYEVMDTIIINTALVREEVVTKTSTNNYSLLAAERGISIAQLTLQERRAERLPFLNFNAAYNFTDNDNTKLINPFSSVQSQFKGFNYGLSISLPILNGLNITRQTKQATINLQQQNTLYEQTKTNTNVAVTNAYSSYEVAMKVLMVEEENILLAKENVTIALESFKRGIYTFIELRTAQQILESAYDRLIAARYVAKVAETELLRLSGALLR
jgi:outer membrane protein